MSKRYPFSSHNVAVMQAYTASTIKLEQNGVTTGRVMWLRGISVSNIETAEVGILRVYDSVTEGANPTVTLQRLTVVIGPSETVVLDYPAPGIKFITGVSGSVTAGTVAAYSVHCTGYEE